MIDKKILFSIGLICIGILFLIFINWFEPRVKVNPGPISIETVETRQVLRKRILVVPKLDSTQNSEDEESIPFRTTYENKRKTNMEILLDYRWQQIEKEREAKRVGAERLEQLIASQPYELESLFALSQDPYDGREYQWIDGQAYKIHLSESSDQIWSQNAIAYLYSIFQSVNFTILRVDCRISACEVAGTINGLDQFSDAEALNIFLETILELVPSEPQYQELFALPQENRPQLFSEGSDEYVLPMPFAMLIYRKTPFTENGVSVIN